MSSNQTKAPLFPDILSLHAKGQREKPVLITGGKTVSWGEFEAATNRVANGLGALGFGPGDMIAVLMVNSRAMVQVLFGIMKAGACSVPINLSVSDLAVTAMIRDSGASAIFASDSEADRIGAVIEADDLEFDGRLFAIVRERQGWTDYAEWMNEQPAEFAGVEIPPDAPCNVIYSSGTTGQPKGILHTFRGRSDWANDVAPPFAYNSNARTLCTIGLYSNIMWVAMLCTLLVGGTLILHEKFNPVRVLEDIEALGITHTAMVPVQYQQLLDAGATREGLKSMISAITVGSKMHRDLKSRMLEVMPDALYELYGLTEGLITVQSPAEGAVFPDSVGHPIPGSDILILGDDGKITPPGESGEIIGWARFMMAGYLNRSEETEAAMWVDDQGREWLRTGDIGYLDDAGSLFVVDRKKDMILSGGQNIYPQDIEAVLAAHENVDDVAVIGVKSRKWGETPIALVVSSGGQAVDTGDLKAWCNERVGRQQRIAEVILVDALQRNPNGKLLKRELRKEFEDREYD